VVKVEVARSILVNGNHCEPGDVVEVPEGIAIELIANRRAVPYEEQKKKTNRSVGLDTSTAEPIVKRTRRKS
jgi:hypothetical protein